MDRQRGITDMLQGQAGQEDNKALSLVNIVPRQETPAFENAQTTILVLGIDGTGMDLSRLESPSPIKDMVSPSRIRSDLSDGWNHASVEDDRSDFRH